MRQSIFHKLSSVLWGAIVSLVVLLAIYVSVGRLLASLTGTYQHEILQALSGRVPFVIDADKVSAEWHSFNPVLVLDGLRLSTPGQTIALAEGRVGFDVAGSLLTRTPQMTHLRLDGLNLAGELDENGRLRIRGFDEGDTPIGEWLRNFLLNVEMLALGKIHLELLMPEGERRDFDLDLALSREGSRRQLEGSLVSSRGLRVSALGDGVGNPFEPGSFSGRLYLDIGAPDVNALTDLLPGRGQEVTLHGKLGLELWSRWDKGEHEAEARVEIRDLLLAALDDSWRVPLDRFTFDAALAERKGGWGLSLAALEMASGDDVLRVPRLQAELLGETLTVRALDIPLGSLGPIMAGADTLAPTAAGVLRDLQPRGSLSALQVRVNDWTAPLAGWQVLGEFHGIGVDSWQGAPGITGATGYLELSPGSGTVLLDSQQFSMDFPTVYEKPLRYDDFLGTIHIDWDDELVALSSGLVEAAGPEGPVKALFGLSIPLVESTVGVEMDLLVGLENTAAGRRAKYIPFILDKNLREWLESSIVEGLIAQGGFLWRGSLAEPSAALHTVQLFFNIGQTVLNYHPDWPPLTDVDGIALIDDANVSVWVARAKLLESDVADLSVELWPDAAGRLWLAVDGSLTGPAADGLAVVNTSPLAEIVGNTFADWRLTGDLATDLKIRLALDGGPVPPEVEVAARLEAVDLDILPGNLPIRGINGHLHYSTFAGFSSSGLTGQLWGRPLQADVTQHNLEGGAGNGAKQAAMVVGVSSVVDMDDIRDWLKLDELAFGQGRAAADMRIEVATGEVPVLFIDSTLAGIRLDLPPPWAKTAEAERPLQIELSLGGESMTIGMELAGGLQSKLELVDGRPSAGSLAFSGELLDMKPGLMRISGGMAQADTDEWLGLLKGYFADETGQVADAGVPRPVVSIEDLRLDKLLVAGRDVGEVILNATDADGHWRIAAETDWLRGELLFNPQDNSRLDIRYLDLAGLDRFELAEASGDQVFELPDVAVTISDLRRADTVYGNLAFDLHSEGPELSARNIIGSIAAMELRSEQPGRLVWHQGQDSRTTIESKLYFQDLAQTLAQLGYQEVIETRDGTFDLALEWPGGPQDFSLPQAQGSLRIGIGKGAFPEVSGGASGALRVVSILNLAEIVQRLSLSHMFESGVPFNEVDGEVFLHAGTIEVAQMRVQGSASSFQFHGVSVVESRTLDGELVITLPVANNLSWVAALTAGLPVAAGVFLLSKVFESQFNRLTSLVYTATGTWDEPQVTFDRVFDNTAAVGAGQSVRGASPVVVPEAPSEMPQSGSP